RERAVEQLPGRADERPSFEILAVAGLLTDEDHVRAGASLAEDGLRARLPERARLAAGGGLAQLLQRRPRRDQRGGGRVSVAVEVELVHTAGVPRNRGYDAWPRRRGREVRQRPAKPRTAVRIRSAPLILGSLPRVANRPLRRPPAARRSGRVAASRTGPRSSDPCRPPGRRSAPSARNRSGRSLRPR